MPRKERIGYKFRFPSNNTRADQHWNS